MATSLLCSHTYPISSLKDLYHKRWGVEEFYKIFKERVKIEQFHSKKMVGVKREIGVFNILNNLGVIIAKKTNKRAKKPKNNSIHSQQKNKKQLIGQIGLVSELLITSKSRIVQSKVLGQLRQSGTLNELPVRKNRSFPRVSNKPINRWQYNNRSYGDRLKYRRNKENILNRSFHQKMSFRL